MAVSTRSITAIWHPTKECISRPREQCPVTCPSVVQEWPLRVSPRWGYCKPDTTLYGDRFRMSLALHSLRPALDREPRGVPGQDGRHPHNLDASRLHELIEKDRLRMNRYLAALRELEALGED